MSDKTFILNYSYEDLQRYASGQMPVAEMHRLEMDSLKDPFLADALEGLMQADESKAKKDVAYIRKQLRSSHKSSEKLIPYAWWKIAAVIILISGAGIITYSLLQPSEKTPLAKTEKTILPPATVPNSAPVINSDSGQKNALLPAEKLKKSLALVNKTARDKANNKRDVAVTSEMAALPKKEISATLAKKDIEQLADIQAGQPHNFNFQKMNIPPPAIEGKAAGVMIRSAASFRNSEFIAGVITDSNKTPLADVSINIKGSKIGTTTNEKGSFILKTPDSTVTASITSLGFQPMEKELRRGIKNDTIKMSPGDRSLNEVVVVGYGTKRKREVTGAISKSPEPPQLNITSNLPGIYPVEGWNEMKSNLKEILEEENEFQKSRWEFEIVFTKKGYPKNVKLVKSTTEKLNDLIIGFFETEGKWQNAAEKTIRIIVEIK